MLQKEQILLPTPPTLNKIIALARSNRYLAAKDKKDWTTRIAALCVGKQQFPDKVWLAFEWSVKNSRHDPDNLCAAKKYILDGLCLAGIIKNDNLSIIQSPFIDLFLIDKKLEENTVLVTVSSLPIYQLNKVI